MTKIKIRKKRVGLKKVKQRLPVEERATLPDWVDVPEAPTYDRRSGEAQEYDEQQVARVELMMMKGVRSKRQLMAMLDITDGRAMDRYIRRIHARWEMVGTTQEFARHRGEGLARLDLIESELWSRLSQLEQKATPQAPLGYLSAIMRVHELRSELLGLTPKVIAHIGTSDDGGSDFARRLAQHDRLTQLAARMSAMVEERMKVIDHGGETT
ncbi:hypothetical protein JYP52_23515 [Nitratireductor aquibiodomus]|uniref:hypothetical protein n=1 Tax=Nitratireductor TaxID=245876 RepID=UPI000DE1550A|nr:MULTISPECIES: hypothetical protein [Nitratireductor]MBN7764104.1 hypothetical protein [Nitratireductor aquibiodomus]